MITLFARELEREFRGTRKMLEAVPFEHMGWSPHEKSMKLGRLAVHIAEMPVWIKMTLLTAELDFAANAFDPFVPIDRDSLLAFYDANCAELNAALAECDDARLNEMWTMRQGDKIFFTKQKYDVVRMDCMNHLYHHRGQLSVYLRLLNVAVPGVYGPTADEKGGMG